MYSSYPVVIQTPEGRQSIYQLELAATPAARRLGLMHRDELGAVDGMLFVWPEEDYRIFWMKDTPLSLDILLFYLNDILCPDMRIPYLFPKSSYRQLSQPAMSLN